MCVYATVTYILFGMCYTMVQIPYGSLASVVTMDDKERSKLSVWRSVGATIGSMPIMVVSAMCVKTLKNEAGEKIGTVVDYKILIFGVIAMALASLIMYIFAFMGNKERVVSHPKKAEKGDTWKAIKRLATNKSMLSISIISMLLLAGQMFTQSYYIYLIKQYFNRGGIWVTLPTILTYFPMAILMGFTPQLVRKFGKLEGGGFGMILAAVANFA
ncbi:MAG: MFS transporter, partial [Bacteriovoracaceae bacterium]|nr:MFS transporter [Bacteriovoracaceae bacterium]